MPRKGLDRKVVKSLTIDPKVWERVTLLAYMDTNGSFSEHMENLAKAETDKHPASYYERIRKIKFIRESSSDDEQFQRFQEMINDKEGYDEYVIRVERSRKHLKLGKGEPVEV